MTDDEHSVLYSVALQKNSVQQGATKYEVEILRTDIIFIPRFVKIFHLVQAKGGHGGWQRDDHKA